MPIVPAWNKWTKTGPSLDFHVGGLCCGNYLSSLCEVAFENSAGSTAKSDLLAIRDADGAAELEGEIREDIEWHAPTTS